MKFPPIRDEDWPARIAGLRDDFAGRLNVYRVMAHHPALLAAWAPLRDHVVLRTALGQQFSEVVILRAGVRLGSSYEWSHHVSRARACGLSEARIASIAGPLADMQADDRILAGAVDALMQQCALPEQMQEELVNLVGQEGMFDLIATVGFYTTLGYILQSFGTPLDDRIADEMADNPPPAAPGNFVSGK